MTNSGQIIGQLAACFMPDDRCKYYSMRYTLCSLLIHFHQIHTLTCPTGGTRQPRAGMAALKFKLIFPHVDSTVSATEIVDFPNNAD